MPVPPKHPSERRRRNATVPMTQLPAAGRPGDPPPWPLPKQTPREKVLWARLWATPAAAAWERLGWGDEVARYVRTLTRAELPDASASLLSVTLQMADRLGLNNLSMLRLRWEVAADELAERREELPPARPKVVDRRALEGT